MLITESYIEKNMQFCFDFDIRWSGSKVYRSASQQYTNMLSAQCSVRAFFALCFMIPFFKSTFKIVNKHLNLSSIIIKLLICIIQKVINKPVISLDSFFPLSSSCFSIICVWSSGSDFETFSTRSMSICQMPRGYCLGDVEASIWLVHNITILLPRIPLSSADESAEKKESYVSYIT